MVMIRITTIHYLGVKHTPTTIELGDLHPPMESLLARSACAIVGDVEPLRLCHCCQPRPGHAKMTLITTVVVSQPCFELGINSVARTVAPFPCRSSSKSQFSDQAVEQGIPSLFDPP